MNKKTNLKTNLIANLIKKLEAKTVLDIGCYNLRQYKAIKDIGYYIEYFGVDVNELDWKNHIQDKNVKLFKQDINNFLKKRNQKFDCIIFSGMFDFLGVKDEMLNYDSFETLNLIKKVMHKDSKLIFVVVNGGVGRLVLNFIFGKMSNRKYTVDYEMISEDLRRLGYNILKNIYLPLETTFLETLRKIFLIGKWANNEIVLVCEKNDTIEKFEYRTKKVIQSTQHNSY